MIALRSQKKYSFISIIYNLFYSNFNCLNCSKYYYKSISLELKKENLEIKKFY